MYPRKYLQARATCFDLQVLCVLVQSGPVGLRNLLCVRAHVCVPCSPCVHLFAVTVENEILFAICLAANLLIAKLNLVSFQILLCDWSYFSSFFCQVFHSKIMKNLYTCTNHFHELCSMGVFSFIYFLHQSIYVFIYVCWKFLTSFM